MTRLTSLFLIVAFLAMGHALARPTDNPSNLNSIKLLDGYVLTIEQGTDSLPGTIAKKGGLSIDFDIGGMAGLYVDPKNKASFQWFQTQTIDGRPVYLALGKPHDKGVSHLTVTYTAYFANFSTDVSSPADVAEALTMILTYRPPRQRL